MRLQMCFILLGLMRCCRSEVLGYLDVLDQMYEELAMNDSNRAMSSARFKLPQPLSILMNFDQYGTSSVTRDLHC